MAACSPCRLLPAAHRFHQHRAPPAPPPRSNAADWYWALPPITRGLITVYLVTGLAAYMGILPLKQMFHNWSLTFKLFPEVRRAPWAASEGAA